jgi:mannosyltransferase
LDHQPESAFIRREYATAISIFLVALALNLYRLTWLSLWSDEVFSVVISRLPLAEMTRPLVQDAVHPPLYYYLLHAWLQLFGLGVLQVRLLSVAFGTASVAVIYFLGRYLFGPRTAALSALILAVSQLSIMYSQEARMYAALSFFVLCSVFCFLVALQKKRPWAWWSCVGFIILAVYTHYYGLLVAAILFVYALYRRTRDDFPVAWLVGGAFLVLLSFVSWLAVGVRGHVFQNQAAMRESLPFWSQVHWFSILSAVNWFNNGKLFGRFGPSPWWAYLAGALLFTLPALLALKPLLRSAGSSSRDRFHREALGLLAALWLVPLAAVAGLGVLGVQYDVHYVAFCAAPYYLLVGQGLSELSSTYLRRGLLTLLVLYSAVSLRSVYFIPYKADTRDTLAYLAQEYQRGDCYIFTYRVPAPEEWQVYRDVQPDLKLSDVDAVISHPADCQRVWFVADRRVDDKTIDEEKRALEKTHKTVKEVLYFWQEIDLFVPRK